MAQTKLTYKEMVHLIKELKQEREYFNDLIDTKLEHIERAQDKRGDAANHRRAMEKLEREAGENERDAEEIEKEIAIQRQKINDLQAKLEAGAEDVE